MEFSVLVDIHLKINHCAIDSDVDITCTFYQFISFERQLKSHVIASKVLFEGTQRRYTAELQAKIIHLSINIATYYVALMQY